MRLDSRRCALLVSAILAVVTVVLIVVLTPWHPLDDPPGGGVREDPAAGLSPEQVERGVDYTGPLRSAAALSIVVGLVVAGLFGLTASGGRLCRALARPLGGGWVWQVLLGTAALVVVGRLATLPMSIYAERRERRYGVSTSSWGLWTRDLVVGTGIVAVIAALVLLLVVWLARRAPRTWWAWAGGAVTALVFAGSFLYPVVIEPAFNNFRSLPEGPLRTELLELADRNGTPVDDVLVADASTRTTALNAYVSGFGSTRRIVIYDTAVRELPDPVIESIVAHELGHVSNDDVLTGTLIGAFGAGAGVCFLGWLLGWSPLVRRTGVDVPGDPRVVAPILFLVTVAALLSTPVQNTVSRHVEERADLHALDLTGDPGSLIDLQRRLAVANVSDPDPPKFWHWAFGSHPSTAERVTAAQNWALRHGS